MIRASQVYPRKMPKVVNIGTFFSVLLLLAFLQRMKLNSSHLEKSCPEITFMLSLVRLLLLMQTVPDFLLP